jgi:epidermal growth factor receptor substrate 15
MGIRDLADIRREGKLGKDEFAVAMFLINNKLAGKDLPTMLPQSMIPPSLRGQVLNANQSESVIPPPIALTLSDLVWFRR